MHRVGPGEEFDAAGFAVRAVGGQHAEIHGGLPDCVNLGYLVDGSVWLKTTEALDFVDAIKPLRTFPIHEAQLNDRGLDSVNGWFAKETDHGYRYLRPFDEA